LGKPVTFQYPGKLAVKRSVEKLPRLCVLMIQQLGQHRRLGFHIPYDSNLWEYEHSIAAVLAVY